jgi:hypothetical protein
MVRGDRSAPAAGDLPTAPASSAPVRPPPVPAPRRRAPPIVQGGLTTTMELAAVHTPFLLLPLRNHFEQNFHVARRLTDTGSACAWIHD